MQIRSLRVISLEVCTSTDTIQQSERQTDRQTDRQTRGMTEAKKTDQHYTSAALTVGGNM